MEIDRERLANASVFLFDIGKQRFFPSSSPRTSALHHQRSSSSSFRCIMLDVSSHEHCPTARHQSSNPVFRSSVALRRRAGKTLRRTATGLDQLSPSRAFRCWSGLELAPAPDGYPPQCVLVASGNADESEPCCSMSQDLLSTITYETDHATM
jgi:hypothetical protein